MRSRWALSALALGGGGGGGPGQCGLRTACGRWRGAHAIRAARGAHGRSHRQPTPAGASRSGRDRAGSGRCAPAQSTRSTRRDRGLRPEPSGRTARRARRRFSSASPRATGSRPRPTPSSPTPLRPSATSATRGRPVVVKADGLCAGKGAIVTSDAERGDRRGTRHAAARSLRRGRRTVIVEDRLDGMEMSVQALCDGQRMLVLPVARDHKRVGDGDTGPNTGGMGALAPGAGSAGADAPHRDARCCGPTVEGMRAEGTPFRGVLYAGLMVSGRRHALFAGAQRALRRSGVPGSDAAARWRRGCSARLGGPGRARARARTDRAAPPCRGGGARGRGLPPRAPSRRPDSRARLGRP